MRMVADIKCYHCGHVSGEVEGTKTDRLVLHSFKPRPGYRGEPPRPGDRLRCERCQGPVYLEDLRPVVTPLVTDVVPLSRKRSRSSRGKAA
jgi:hypothetical protein